MSAVKTIAVIPARGGSKRIPGKNIKEFCGKPIIAWSIEAAFSSGLFDQVFVTTDDPKIAKISQEYGAICPFERPEHLSDDHTPTLPVIRHAIETIEQGQVEAMELVCCIYATAPFITSHNLIEGYQTLQQNQELEFAFSVTNYVSPIQRALYIDSDTGVMKMFQPGHANSRSQDLRVGYHDAGQFYWGRRDAFLTRENMFAAKSAPVILPREQVQDIDTQQDWDCAEQLFHLNHRDSYER